MPSYLSVAANLPPERRKDLAIHSLAGTEPLAKMAAREGISRKFLYRQKRKAEAALDQAFVPFEDDPAVLFYLPVTAAWLTQLVLGLILICHSSYLAPIRVGLHDEIFQGNQPVLAGVDAHSTYCYLLAEAEHRDGDTWGVHLLDAQA
jgi:hypothetical protein